MIILDSVKKCTESSSCGEGEFCNFDDGDSGNCEKCRFHEKIPLCDVIKERGKDECASVCKGL